MHGHLRPAQPPPGRGHRAPKAQSLRGPQAGERRSGVMAHVCRDGEEPPRLGDTWKEARHKRPHGPFRGYFRRGRPARRSHPGAAGGSGGTWGDKMFRILITAATGRCLSKPLNCTFLKGKLLRM